MPIEDKGYKSRYNKCRVAAIAGKRMRESAGETERIMTTYTIVPQSRGPINVDFLCYTYP
jgi:hypothetical protein